MITPKDIERKTMSPEKRKEASKSIWGFYIGRPITYVLTIPFLYTNISPNTVTYISLIFSVLGLCFLSFGNSMVYQLLGLFFIFMWSMYDGVDGNIARYKNQKSEGGDILDTLGGYMSMAFVFLAMGNATLSSRNIWNMQIGQITNIGVFLGGVSATLTLIPRLLMHRKIANSKDKSGAEKLKEKEDYSLAKIVALNLCDPAGFQEIIMLVCIILGRFSEFTLFYFVFNLAVAIYSIRSLVRN
ncbi:MAG: CDP-alcohol phosphatidyltransferase family protein [Lachnospiraceae bacterium]|jgi:hypothetical protein|nr:CDP-alcohol phosphatidyltransferase family protein [Lachnospiraceae bacterium]MDY5704143.1 CDP-alcohol phosphatidyltransferase family protein [Lachnospiraceae bacterium]